MTATETPSASIKRLLARNTAARAVAVTVALAGMSGLGALAHAQTGHAHRYVAPALPSAVSVAADPVYQPTDVIDDQPVDPAPVPTVAPDVTGVPQDTTVPLDTTVPVQPAPVPTTAPVQPEPQLQIPIRMDSDGDGTPDWTDDTPYQDNYGDPDGDGIETQYDDMPDVNNDPDLDGITDTNDYNPDSHNTDPGDTFDMDPNHS